MIKLNLTQKILAAVVTVSLASSVFAAGAGSLKTRAGHSFQMPTESEMEARFAEHQAKMFEAIKATPQQQAQINAIHAANKPERDVLLKEMMNLHEKGKVLKDSGSTDAATRSALKSEMDALHTKMKVQHDGVRKQVNAILTAEQVKALEALHSRHEGRRGGIGGMKGDMGSMGDMDGVKEMGQKL